MKQILMKKYLARINFYSEIQLTLGEEFKKDNFIESNVILNKKEVEKELEKLSVQIKIKKNKTKIKILKDLEITLIV